MSTDAGTDLSVQPDVGGAMEIATSRAMQEVQGAMVMAKRFPRDETASLNRILTACKRRGLAEESQYEYARGGTRIAGASIRLAEVMARCWGNVQSGVIELEQRNGESVVQAYAWDLETNTRQEMTFTVKHRRDTKGGGYVLTESRDIYEMCASQGARRRRACILGVIPGDIQDLAIEECNKTLKGDNKEPLIDRIRKMVLLFSEVGVTQEMIELRIQCKVETATLQTLVTLGKAYTSIKDGMSTREQHFPMPDGKKPAEGQSASDAMADRVAGEKVKEETKPTAAKPPPAQSQDDEFAEAEAVQDYTDRLASAQEVEQCVAIGQQAAGDAALGTAAKTQIAKEMAKRTAAIQAPIQGV